jgi:hypothetical protein
MPITSVTVRRRLGGRVATPEPSARGVWIHVADARRRRDGTVPSRRHPRLQLTQAIDNAGGRGLALPGDASKRDVVRTRVSPTHIRRWEEAADAHDARRRAPPAAAMLDVGGFVDPAMLVRSRSSLHPR